MAAKLATMRTWYEIRNAADDVAEVFIYDDIGESFWTEGVTAKNFLNELAGITAPRINLHLNSPGGSVFDGVAIYNALKRHPAQVVSHIDGLAASIASIIALAGDRVVMASNSLFMIHNPWGGVQGDANEMRKMADVLDKIRDTLAATYMERTGMEREAVLAAMDAETWYNASEAYAAGFVDEVGTEIKAAASFDLSARGYKHVPVAVTVEPSAAEPDSELDGASDPAAQDGASEQTPEETVDAVYVAGIGFANFKRKRKP